MGLVHGKGRVLEDFSPFCGLTRDGILQAWISFNELSESFALDLDIWCAIWWNCKQVLNIPGIDQIDQHDFKRLCEKAFDVLDTDENGLIDALEGLSILAMLSSAPEEFKMHFVFMLYDFDACDEMALDELSLLLKTVANGLVKICAKDCAPARPIESNIELVSQTAFRLTNCEFKSSISYDKFRQFAQQLSTEILCWMSYFDLDIGIAPRKTMQSKLMTISDAGRVDGDSRPIGAEPRHWEQSIIDMEPSTCDESRQGCYPDHRLSIRQTFGFNEKCETIFIGENEDIVYGCGCVVVRYVRETGKQSFYTSHTSKVVRLAKHRYQPIMASFGETGELLVWSLEDMTHTIQRIFVNPSLIHFSAIEAMNFGGKEQQYIVLVGGGGVVLVFDRSSPFTPVFSYQVECFHPGCGALRVAFYDECNSFALCSTNYSVPIFFQKEYQEHRWIPRQGILNHRDEVLMRRHIGIASVVAFDTIVPADPNMFQDDGKASWQAFDRHRVYTGSTSGDIVEWRGRNSSRLIIDAHPSGKAIVSLDVVQQAQGAPRLVSCSENGQVKVWGYDLAPLHEVKLAVEENKALVVNWMHVSKTSSRAMITTHDQRLIPFHVEDETLDVESGQNLLTPFSLGAGARGTTTADGDQLIMGRSFDGTLVFFRENVVQHTINGNSPIHSITCSSCSTLLAVARESSVDIYKLSTRKRVWCLEDFTKTAPRLVRFSPDNSTLVVCCENGVVFVYQVNELRFGTSMNPDDENSEIMVPCQGKVNLGRHSDPTAIDFTSDCTAIRIEFQEEQRICFVNLDGALAQVENVAKLKDQTWDTATCVFAWGVHGAWPEKETESCPSSVWVKQESRLALIGRTDGTLETRFWPAFSRESGASLYIKTNGHSSKIASVELGKGEQNWCLTMDEKTAFLWELERVSSTVVLQPGNKEDEEEVKKPKKKKKELDVSKYSLQHPASFKKSLSLEWVHGVSSTLRDGSHYVWNKQTKGFELVYTSGPVVIAYDVHKKTQRHFLVHDGPELAGSSISCISVACEDGFIAVGGEKGRIWILDIVSMDIIGSLKLDDFPITCLAFDPSNPRVLVWASSLGKTLVHVCSWQTGATLASLFSTQFASETKFISIAWQLSGSQFVMCSDLGVAYVVKKEADGFHVTEQYTLGAVEDTVPSFSGACWFGLEEEYLTFSDDQGNLWFASSHRPVPRLIKSNAHRNKITCIMRKDPFVIVTAGVDGHVKTWDYSFVVRAMEEENEQEEQQEQEQEKKLREYVALSSTIEISKLVDCHKSVPGVLGISFSTYGFGDRKNRVGIANSNAQIMEVDTDTQELLHLDIQGHGGSGSSSSVTCAVAPHPKDPSLFCSVGSDGWLSITRISMAKRFEGEVEDVDEEHQLVRIVCREKLDVPAKCCAFSSNGQRLAIGHVGSYVALFKFDEGANVLSKLDSIGDTSGGGKKKEYVRMVKFSLDGKYLGVATKNKIIVYDGSNLKQKIAMIDSHSLPVQQFDFSQDARLIRSYDQGGKLLYHDVISATEVPLEDLDNGATRWMTDDAAFVFQKEEDITDVFSLSFQPLAQEERGLTVDGDCILQWKQLGGFGFANEQEAEPDHFIIKLDWQNRKRELSVSDDDSAFPIKGLDDRKALGDTLDKCNKDHAPSNVRGEITGVGLLEDELMVEHVFGCDSKTGGPFLLDDPHKLCWTSGGLLVTSDLRAGGKQALSLPMNVRIVSIARSPCGRVAASLNSSGLIQIWDTNTCINQAQFFIGEVDFATGGKLAFSPDGLRIACAVGGKNGGVRLHIYSAPQRIWAGQNSFLERMDSLFPEEKEIELYTVCWTGPRSILIGGLHFITFLTNIASSCMGFATYWAKEKNLAFTCSTPRKQEGVALVGTNTGVMIEFLEYGLNKGRIVEVCPDSQGFVSCLTSSQDAIITGDSKGIVKLFREQDLSPITTIVNRYDINGSEVLDARIKSLSVDAKTTRLLIGALSGQIFLTSLQSGSMFMLESPHDNNNGNQVWSLAINRSNPSMVATASDQGFIRVWDMDRNVFVASYQDDQEGPIRALDWSPDGFLIAAGYGSPESTTLAGSFHIINAATLEILFQGRDSKEWIRDVRFSPNGNQLAVASQDGNIYLYDAKNGFKLQSVATRKPEADKEKSGFVAIDFARESMFIRAMDENLDLAVFNCSNGEQLNEEDIQKLKDLVWDSFHCSVAWGVNGFWRQNDAIITTSDCTFDQKIVASGTAQGILQLANFPHLNNSKTKPFVRHINAHVSSISRLLFDPAQKFLYTTGLADCTLVKWKTNFATKNNMKDTSD